jgi:hypothetical protein
VSCNKPEIVKGFVVTLAYVGVVLEVGAKDPVGTT